MISDSRSKIINKKAKEFIDLTLNNCRIIQDTINKQTSEIKSEQIDKEKILLILAEELTKKSIKKPKLKPYIKNIPDEFNFENKLSKIPNICKSFFRKIYKQILFENRCLNKDNDVVKINIYEKQIFLRKMKELFNDEAHKNMILLKDNIVKNEDDIKAIKEHNKYDYYGSVEGLEWLLMKQFLLNSYTKYIGAYNPVGNTNIGNIKYKI